MSPNGVGGGGLIEGGALSQKNDFQRGGLSERGGGLNSDVGFNRDFTVKQQSDKHFLKSTFGPG